MLVTVILFPVALPAQAVRLRRAELPVSVASLFPDSVWTAPHVVGWDEALAVAGVISMTFLVDEPLERYLQRHRSNTSNDVAHAFRHMGQPEIYGTVSLGLIGGGLLAHRPNVTRAGGRLAVSLVLSAVELETIKRLTGRARPDSGLGAFHFDPLSHSEALPSGHATVAFTLAASLADDIHRPWATVGLYTLATGTAYSRLNDNRHWLSDVALGAALGITTAKLVDGHWQVFGIHPPHVLLDPAGPGMEASFTF